MQALRGPLRRLQLEPHPIGRLVLRCQHTLPKQPLLPSRSFPGPHNDPSLALPYPPLTTPPSLTALSLNRRPLLGYIWVCGPQSLAANPPLSWQVARSNAWALLATQCPTCQIAALLYALVSDAEGPYLNRPSQRKPLSVSDICPAKLVTWHPAIPKRSNSLAWSGANSNPTKVRPGAVLGYPNRVRAGSAERTRLGRWWRILLLTWRKWS